MYICDWEEFRLADAARDLGSFAGEWLHRAVRGLAGYGGNAAVSETVSHEEIVRRMADGIAAVRPRVVAFCSGYRQARPTVDPGLHARAAGFAGWHLFDRMLASARRSSRLGALERAAAGIGRSVLLAPADYAATLGLVT
jgi:hypothetical protein